MNEIIQKNPDFAEIYNKSCRLAAAVFLVSNVMDKNEELETKIKNLSLKLVSMSVDLKDVNFLDAKKLITEIEKICLELMSILNIAGISGLISKMNENILKEEFQAFIPELNRYAEKFSGSGRNVSVKGVFNGSGVLNTEIFNNPANPNEVHEKTDTMRIETPYKNSFKNIAANGATNGAKNGNGHKRKDLRKNMILEFIKGHNNVSIKDIVPNISGCSEKTVQRELIELIEEGKIKKTGERRWSKYSTV